MKLTETECEHLAGKVFDIVIAPSIRSQWEPPLNERRFNRFFDAGMIIPPLLLVNGVPVYSQGEVVDSRRRAWDREYAESLQRLDRKELVPLLKVHFISENYTKDYAEERFSGYASNLWWQIMEEIEKYAFQVKKGRKAKAILADYKKIAILAEELFPVCEKLFGLTQTFILGRKGFERLVTLVKKQEE